MHNTKKPQVPTESESRCVKSSRLIEEVPSLPKRFFTFPQEGISMLWLDNDPTKPERGTRVRK